ncbi:copper homeostasis protein CutC [Streptomyces radicis]|uniref:PF03932 family protein CutC n=1 Tax=Streptomyces radicis TaxID=1750517 RepID=A0A3A9VWQ3_9ACTN|nr:copper homeostasis protein CutC [Streptomyces radicis]RKN04603.1 copper homeostasis protein CutC [Streptomyces radicis]RKN15560.1 copper homeostasis protein CutC [Streptomyces radicis]
MSPRFEVCVDSARGAVTARDAGAHRVELCSALFDGGVTPSAGLLETVVEAARGIAVNVLIRPRGGDFIYDRYEVDAMVRDIGTAVRLGAHGIVLGALTAEGAVDMAVCRRLLAAADGRPVTFHRAFDMAREPFEALERLVELGVERVLTSGQEISALEGAPLLARLVRAAGDRVIVMPGGGVTARNVSRVLRLTGAREIHFSAGTTVDSPATHRNSRALMGGTLSRGEYTRRITGPAEVRALMNAARAPEGSAEGPL